MFVPGHPRQQRLAFRGPATGAGEQIDGDLAQRRAGEFIHRRRSLEGHIIVRVEQRHVRPASVGVSVSWRAASSGSST
jgi:hypothetical protein